MVTIIDYDAGNLRSVENALQFLGEEAKITRDPQEILKADKVILPGVGAFGDAMEKLHKYNLVSVIREVNEKQIPFLGICLGLQLLFEESDETPGVKGLCVLPGKIKAIPPKKGFKIPHMGWNYIQIKEGARLFQGIPQDAYVYFVHSYACEAQRPEDVLTTTEYGRPFHSAVQRGNVMGMQFHPEKSGLTGQRLLRNFVEMTRAASGKEG